MRLITKVAILFIIVKLSKSAPDPCSFDLEESACDQTEYEAYKECVHNEIQNEVRRKREATAPCPQNNLESLKSIKENCQRANFDCRINCGEDESCLSQCPVCPINVDELIASSNNTGEDHRTIIVESDQNVEKFQTINAAGNITTVIRLTNIINTTSSFSDQFENNDNVATNETGGDFGLGFNANGSCCYVVHPKTCTSTSNGPRCHHRREKTCGKLCTAKVIHAQVRKRCSKANGCQKKIVYVPQPKRQKCVHKRNWPYVSCGQPARSNCDGCYDHYGYGYDEDEEEDKDCEGCYDDAFEYGPLYRRGPVLRPYFYHAPPCYVMGMCYPYPLDCGYGCFDHQFIDPGWGHHHRRHQEEKDDEEIVFEDAENDSENSNATSAKKREEGTDDWAIELHKCKVVSDNGTIEIRNCTSEDIEDNPYAGAPSDIPYDEEDEEDYDGLGETVRIQRHVQKHVNKRRAHRAHVVYIPVLENLNYDEEASEDYDYDDFPRRHRSRKPKSHPRKNSFVYDDDEEDEETHIK